jgi:hypothetical protein
MISKTTLGLSFGLKSLGLRRQFIDRLKLRKKISSHPMLLPLVLCELLAERYCEAVDTSTKCIFEMETSLGVHDYVSHKTHSAGEPANLDFTAINQSLHGELSRLANYVLDQVSYTGYVFSAVQALLRQPRNQPSRLHFQPYRLHHRGFH